VSKELDGGHIRRVQVVEQEQKRRFFRQVYEELGDSLEKPDPLLVCLTRDGLAGERCGKRSDLVRQLGDEFRDFVRIDA
jgi:hypothetical protein